MNLNLVIGSIVVLVHCLEPAAVIVSVRNQVDIELALDPTTMTERSRGLAR